MSYSNPVVRVEALNVMAGGRNLLADMTFIASPRERIAIIGANGAGKTTLLKTLTGMMLPVSGTVEVLGKPVSAQMAPIELRQLRTRIGQVFQGLHLAGRLSALENVLIGALGRSPSMLTCARLFPGHERDRARAALESVGIAHLAPLRLDRLSGGERQKVAVARALNQDPELILADEPTANLDPIAAREIADLLARLAEERGLALITVAHTLSLLPNLAERVIGLKSGRILFDQPIDTVDEIQMQQLYRADAVIASPHHANVKATGMSIP
jgi:phosphonate transport system ATP-binding protein